MEKQRFFRSAGMWLDALTLGAKSIGPSTCVRIALVCPSPYRFADFDLHTGSTATIDLCSGCFATRFALQPPSPENSRPQVLYPIRSGGFPLVLVSAC